MSAEKDLTAALAEEIRAAVAKTAPAPRPGSPPSTSQAALEDVGKPLERAEAHLTPVVPAGVPLASVKRLALRAARFLWRDQTSFNALSLEAMIGLRQAAEEARGALASLSVQLQDLRRETEDWKRDVDAFDAAWMRRAAIQDGRLARLESVGVASPAAAAVPQPGAPDLLPAGVYSLFEERFRGSPEDVAAKQAFYLPFLSGAPGAVLDAGSGRGEFLRLLRSRDIPARGVEINPISVEACRSDGLDVSEGDALEALADAPSGSLGGVVAFQVVEHWSATMTFRFLQEARRALHAGGVLIVETINTDSLSALRAFFLDPTHVRPVPPDALQFLAESAGFVDLRIEYRGALPEAERLAENSANDEKLNRLLFAPQDYALIGRTPEAGA